MFEKNKIDQLQSSKFSQKKKDAALKILKAWRKNKQFKITGIYSAVRVLQADELGKTSGIMKLKEEVKCGQCKTRTAIRFCEICPEF